MLEFNRNKFLSVRGTRKGKEKGMERNATSGTFAFANARDVRKNLGSFSRVHEGCH